jgi:predicted lipase
MSLIYKYINNKNGMENLQSIVIVSIFLFLYEFIIFNYNLVPTARSKINKFINNLNYDTDNIEIAMLKPLLQNNIILNTMNVFYDREEKLRNKINTYTFITGLILLIALIYLLLFLHKKQKINNNVIAISLIILVIIFIFQYLFYLYGKNYYYIDSISTDELQYFIINNL